MRRPNVVRDFNIPLKDKILVEDVWAINWFELVIRELKERLVPIIFDPISNMEDEINEFRLRICSHKDE